MKPTHLLLPAVALGGVLVGFLLSGTKPTETSQAPTVQAEATQEEVKTPEPKTEVKKVETPVAPTPSPTTGDTTVITTIVATPTKPEVEPLKMSVSPVAISKYDVDTKKVIIVIGWETNRPATSKVYVWGREFYEVLESPNGLSTMHNVSFYAALDTVVNYNIESVNTDESVKKSGSFLTQFSARTYNL